MNRHNKGQFFLLIAAVVVSYFVVIACANRGSGPQGGPKDITPPHPIKSTPKLNALNYKKNRIEIIFDEIVQVEKAFDNVIISPPQKQMPFRRLHRHRSRADRPVSPGEGREG